MPDFNDYHLDPDQFSFLDPFRRQWQGIRDEFDHFLSHGTTTDMTWALTLMGPKSKTITTKGASKYRAFGILFQGQFIEDYIQTHQIAYPDGPTNPIATVRQLRQTYFPCLNQIIEQVNHDHDQVIRNVYFGTFFPGLDIKLHVNDNPHMNRGYLGLIVPKGDVAMKICHDTLHWHEGEFMVLDHSYPHCPHNYTNQDRTVLVVDFFKQNQPRADLVAFETRQVTQRMQDNPYSLGVFGQSDRAKKEDFVKYGLAHQLEWDKALNA